ncbi:MAG TPA: hypothetical protein VGD60_02350 [Candidatus Acidoferrales bacterium]
MPRFQRLANDLKKATDDLKIATDEYVKIIAAYPAYGTENSAS